MLSSGPLLRPSSLARFWELQQKTVIQWIHDGRLPAVRSPGGQWRVRGGDLVDFCAQARLPLPPSARPRTPRLHVIGARPPAMRAIKRALRDVSVVIDAASEPLDGLLGAVRSPPSALAIDASSRAIDPQAAVRALRKNDAGFPIVVFGVTTDARARALVKAGATRAIAKGDADALAAALVGLLVT
jgi:excisionase family DNA binding protein